MDIFKGIRPLDYVLAALMTGLAVLLGVANTAGDTDAAHALDSSSWWIVPVFVAAAVPILFRRRHTLVVVGISAAVMAASVPMFGWITRCGFALPLSFALAYAVGRYAPKPHQLLGLAGIAVLQVATLVKDASTDGIAPIVGALPIALIFYGVARMVQTRADKRTAPATPVAERVAV